MGLQDYKFNSDTFKSREFKRFGLGVFKVKITDVDADVTSGGTDYFRVSIEGENGESDRYSKMFLSPKSYEFTARTILGICVHNCPDEESKDKMREYFTENVKDGNDLLDMLKAVASKKGEAWVNITEGNEYVKSDGSVAHGVNYNFYGFDPTEMLAKRKDDVESVKKVFGDEVEVLPEQHD